MKTLKSFKFQLLLLTLSFSIIVNAAYVSNMAVQVIQPDGTTLDCFTTGDEFYRVLHDKDGYTIVQSDVDGYYYYAVKQDNKLTPSTYRAGIVNPETKGLSPWLRIPAEEYRQLVDEYYDSSRQKVKPFQISNVSSGILTNIVIYVRFKGESEYTKSRREFSTMLESTTSASVKDYFNEISYGKLSVISQQFPVVSDSSITVSYEDIHPRSYYQPHNAVTNTNGYINDGGDREQALVKRAIDAVSSEIPTSIVVDADGDNHVDNVTIVIKGNADGWGNLLWPHKWWLYKTTAFIHGKRVGNYVFITENMYNVRVMCHELFHVVGAPDLYHYTDNGINPAGAWDIMQGGSGHPTAYMKWKYTGNVWIKDIPEITTSGEYTLLPLTNPDRNCFIIKSPYSSNEYIVVEYRKQQGRYESKLPQTGMLIYRINTHVPNGNGGGPPDELYIFRPEGTEFSNGNLSKATFGDLNAQRSFNYESNPRAVLTDHSELGIDISNIRIKGDSVLFNVNILDPLIDKSAWIVTASSHEPTGNHAAANIKDDMPNTIWHSGWTAGTNPRPHWLQIDFGKPMSFKGVKYLPRQDMENGRIKDYDLLVSKNGTDWNKVASGTLLNTKLEQTISFPEQYCRYLRLVSKNEVSGRAVTAIAELNLVLNNYLMPRSKWTVSSVSGFHTGFEPALAFDSWAKSIWHTKYSPPADKYPHEITIDMNDTCSVDGLFYLPRQDASTNGTIAQYRIHTSLDAANWHVVAEGEWANNKAEKIVRFNPIVCRFVRLEALSEVNNSNFASAAEIALYGLKSNDITPPRTPKNFRVIEKEESNVTLSWERDNTDETLLYYELSINDSIVHNTYENNITFEIDASNEYLFSLKAIDSSGNISDPVQLLLNSISNIKYNDIVPPIIYSNNQRIIVQNIRKGDVIQLFNSIGQLISQVRSSSDIISIELKTRGLFIVKIVSGEERIISSKLLVQ